MGRAVEPLHSQNVPENVVHHIRGQLGLPLDQHHCGRLAFIVGMSNAARQVRRCLARHFRTRAHIMPSRCTYDLPCAAVAGACCIHRSRASEAVVCGPHGHTWPSLAPQLYSSKGQGRQVASPFRCLPLPVVVCGVIRGFGTAGGVVCGVRRLRGCGTAGTGTTAGVRVQYLRRDRFVGG